MRSLVSTYSAHVPLQHLVLRRRLVAARRSEADVRRAVGVGDGAEVELLGHRHVVAA